MRYFRLLQEANLRSAPNGPVLTTLPTGYVISGSGTCRVGKTEWLQTQVGKITGFVAVGPAESGYVLELPSEGAESVRYDLVQKVTDLENELLLLRSAYKSLEDKAEAIRSILR